MLKNVTPKTEFQDIEELSDELDINLPYSENVSILNKPINVGGISYANRFVALPMEGCASTVDGAPSELSFIQYNKFAAGGSGTIWVEAAAVCKEGRSNLHAFMINKDNVSEYKRLVVSMREKGRKDNNHEIYTILQLTHAGRYSRPNGVLKGKYVHKSPYLGADYDSDELSYADDEYLDLLVDKFVDGAKFAKEAGFDAVDIKTCHGYLFSELLAAHTRKGKYGGSYENRTRLLKSVILEISKRVSIDIAIRLNSYDGVKYPYGWGVSKDNNCDVDLSEPKRLVKELADMGVIMFGITIGYPRNFPHFGRPSSRSIDGGVNLPEHPLVGINRFINITSSIQKVIPKVPVVIAGLGWLRHLMPNVATGMVEDDNGLFVGQGRGMFAYPNSVNDLLLKGEFNRNSTCITCSKCSALMKSGGPTGCVIWDDQYKTKGSSNN